MYEILSNALSIAIGVVIGQFVYDEINRFMAWLQYRHYDYQARQREWEEDDLDDDEY